jgi:hypothetical protein
MAKSYEERTAGRFLEVFNRLDFKPAEFAYYMTRGGYVYQAIMWKVIKHMMEFWQMDLEKGDDKGNKTYLRQTIFAAQIVDLMNQQERSIDED